jgi:hypothetical protein
MADDSALTITGRLKSPRELHSIQSRVGAWGQHVNRSASRSS